MLEYFRRKTTCSIALRWARYRVRSSGLDALFAKRPASALAPQAYDLWNLYCEVRRFRPKTIVEFGTGCSTLVMAEALRQNGIGKLHVVEANEAWLDTSRRELPSALAPHVEYRFSPLTMTEVDGDLCHTYVDVPAVAPEMIYLDGPSPSDVPDAPAGMRPIAADPLLFEDRLLPGFRMIVDSRRENVAFLKKHLKRKYRVRTHDIFGVTTFALLR